MMAAAISFVLLLWLCAPRAAAEPPPTRIFGRPQAQQPALPAQPPTAPTGPSLEQRRAENAALRAPEEQRTTTPTAFSLAVPGATRNDLSPQRAFSHRYFEIERLSAAERRRYFELEGQNKQLALPVALTAISGALTLAVSSMYLSSLNDVCMDSWGYEYSCPYRPSVLAIAVLPAAGLAIGAVLLRRRLPRRREFNVLRERGMSIRTVFAANRASLSISF